MGAGSSCRPNGCFVEPGKLQGAYHVSLDAGSNADDSFNLDWSKKRDTHAERDKEIEESAFFATGYLKPVLGRRARTPQPSESSDDFNQDESAFFRQITEQVNEYSTTLIRQTAPSRQVSASVDRHLSGIIDDSTSLIRQTSPSRQISASMDRHLSGIIEHCAKSRLSEKSLCHQITTSTVAPSEFDDGVADFSSKETFRTSVVVSEPEQEPPFLEDSQEPGCTKTSPPCKLLPPHCRQTSDWQWDTPIDTLILIDWDDTLCPTSACECLMNRTPTESEWSSLCIHTAEVEKLLRNAAELGHVVILTMAKAYWIEDCIATLMHGISNVLQELGIKIVSARDVAKQQVSRCAFSDERDPSQYLKTQAMENVIRNFYKNPVLLGGKERPSCRSWKNILSIGDSSAERFALQDVVFRRMQRGKEGEWKECRCKTVLLLPEPSLEQLTKQVRMLQKVVSTLVHHDGDLDVNVHADNIAIAMP